MEALIAKKAAEAAVEPELVKAIIAVESGGQPLVVRFEPDWRYLLRPELYARRLKITIPTETMLQQFSWGLMQVMGSVARELGFNGHMTQLCDVETNLHYGCKKLAMLTAKYPTTSDAIAAYNAGSPRMVQGRYDNQGYVDKVYAAWSRHGGPDPKRGA
jgi:soluble lytic murein transglycosylase-like protein